MHSDVLYLMRRQGRYHWTLQITSASCWSGNILQDKFWGCARTRSYRTQGSYMLGRECEQSYQLDKFWLILLTDIDRASREGMKYCRCWLCESTYWIFLLRQEPSRSYLWSEIVLLITVSSVCFSSRDCIFCEPSCTRLVFLFRLYLRQKESKNSYQDFFCFVLFRFFCFFLWFFVWLWVWGGSFVVLLWAWSGSFLVWLLASVPFFVWARARNLFARALHCCMSVV